MMSERQEDKPEKNGSDSSEKTPDNVASPPPPTAAAAAAASTSSSSSRPGDPNDDDSISKNMVNKRPHHVEGDNDDEEDEITMMDVIKDTDDLEEDAKRVLGGVDADNCTYLIEGYAKRQPLYACRTCIITNDDEVGGGVCLGCSYHCHEGHDLVELYTKRKFKCDCGNSKFPAKNKCKLMEKKMPENEDNKYNQNFKGLYCICHRPYPDPEETIADEMIQCIVCEDWYHGRHLQLKESGYRLPENEEYDDLICHLCCNKFKQQLWKFYGHLLVLKKENKETVDEKNDEHVVDIVNKECPRKMTIDEDILSKNHGLFWVHGWRRQLCSCDNCKKLYDELKLDYLLDPEDTIAFHESKALEKNNESKSSMEKGMEALSAMDRVKQVEAISSYNSMKTDLMDYLKKFAETGKVVKSEDITKFFEQMKERKNKKPRIEIPEFCK